MPDSSQVALPGGWDYTKNPIGPLHPYPGSWDLKGVWHPDTPGAPNPIQGGDGLFVQGGTGTLLSPTEYWNKYPNQSPNPTPPGTGTVPGGLGSTINGPGGGNIGYKPPTMPTQNQGTSPFQNTQYNPLTSYNFMSIGGQGSMNQNPFLNNDPAGGTMMNQSQGFYKSLPNYGFYQ